MSNPLFPTGYGGLADSRWSGLRGSVAESVGIDAHSVPGLIKVHQKLAKESGTTITELCKASVACSDGSKLWFSSESGKIWREVAGTYTLVYTSAFLGFDVRTAGETTKTADVSAEVNIPYQMRFKSDGLVMYMMCNAKVGGANGKIFQYDLSVAWDISTAVYSGKSYTADPQGTGFAIKSDGTKIYVSENTGGNSVIEYTLSTAWDISTASASGVSYSFSAQTTSAVSLSFNATGTRFYVMSNTTIYQYNLSTAWNLTTVSYSGKSYTLPGSIGYGLDFNPSGTSFYFVNITANPDAVTQCVLGTANEIDTITATHTYGIASSRFFGFSLAGDGSGFYTADQGGATPETIYQYTLDAADPDVACLDAAEHDGNVYYATKNRVSKVPVANIDDFDGVIYNLKFLDPQDGPRPMVVQNLQLFVGNGQNVSYVDVNGAFFATSSFNLKKPEIITTMTPFDIDLVVGTQRASDGRVLRWDTFSDSWSAEDTVFEKGGIKAFIRDDNYLYACAGESGRLYFYNGEKLDPEKRIRGTWSPSHTATVHKNSVGYFNGIPVFGLSSVVGAPCKMGIYTYGSYSKDYTRILDLAYPKGNTYDNLQVGAILVDGQDLRVAFSDGVYKLDWSNKYEYAHIETRQLTALAERSEIKTYTVYRADYVSLPVNTGIGIKYRDKYASSFTAMTTMTDAELEEVRAELSVSDVTSLQLRYDFTVSGNNAPEVENFAIE